MQHFLRVFLTAISLVLILLLLGSDAYYVDNTGAGTARWMMVVGTNPVEPYDCTASQEGRPLYVNDTDDSAASYFCFCGVKADDTSYEWLRNDGSDCF